MLKDVIYQLGVLIARVSIEVKEPVLCKSEILATQAKERIAQTSKRCMQPPVIFAMQ